MLQLLLAVAFSAVPLTLYIPPIRILSLFVESLEHLFRHASASSLRVLPRLRLLFSRLLSTLLRAQR
ncbi:hypothetical protein CEY00_Acc10200 [Actinidia chinensis var. chinensis]|uniref:Uncharacterized protein n=1 Tax=Actinidia chinensis var. chinensis TaxID=1590841 RepID=A0A2R6R569_ACTCC|nr:hypothetical protein CEY00_Acc10200 [Actinidia chinensis var. chinensis]